MRWRIKYRWGIVIGIAFLAMMALHNPPRTAVQNQSSASGTPVPVAFIQPEAVVRNFQLHSGYGDPANVRDILPHGFGLVRTLASTVRVVETAGLIDGPLHRRPPPSFS
jgi:hypothetical protein